MTTELTHRRESNSTHSSLSIPIQGMTCASCVGRVEKALKGLPGVEHAAVNFATERADVVLHNPEDAAGVTEAIAAAGYAIPEVTTELAISGMSCASCVSRVERALKSVPAVTDASVNLATERATIRHPSGVVGVEALEQAVRQAGYEPHPVAKEGMDEHAHHLRETDDGSLRRSFVVAALLTLPVFAIEMGSHLYPGVHDWVMAHIGHQQSWYLQLVLTTIVLFGPGLRFYKIGVPALLRGAPEMNSLVVLGASAAYAYSVVATFFPAILPAGTVNVYYEAAAVIVTLILLGRTLEARAKGRTSDAIKHLVGLQPKIARVVRDGDIVELSLADVRPGDVIQVRPGDRVPVDGQVTLGASFVDESMISGEPVPVEKLPGMPVVGGTINKSGSFDFRATKVGSDTLLAQIIRMVQAAQGAKLPIQAVVDRVTGWFVPAVIVAAVLTFLAWLVFGPQPALAYALVNAVAVLIIACPCAMGLATPTSIMVGTGRAAEIGVLFRQGEALQTLKDVDVVAFDKTGTLTRGRPELTDLVVADGFAEREVLAIVAAVESKSEHPIAEAIVAAAKASNLSLPSIDRFEAVPGFGVVAEIDKHAVQVGADRFMRELGYDIGSFGADAERLGLQGKSPLYAAIDGKVAAIIAVADRVKPSTLDAIRALHGLGLKTAMITGDNRRTAEAIAHEIGIDEVVAEVLPEGKVDALQRLRQSGRTIAFVGDGINDAPALAAADIGLAVGTGTDIAIESADVVLMSGDLRAVASAIAISKATIRNVHQNLFWAFAYNVALIPVAAGILYPINGALLSPMVAAGAMALSSVFVLGNALRLRRFTPAIHDSVAV